MGDFRTFLRRVGYPHADETRNPPTGCSSADVSKTIFMPDEVHAYLVGHAVRETTVQRQLRAATRRIPGAGMQIAPEQGALMQILVRLLGAKRYLEIGTFTGYSALCVALAMPREGRLTCCD
jgi:predicted O-methyltransferase YrrM